MKKKVGIVAFVILLILIIAGGAIGLKLKEKYSYSKEEVDLAHYYNVPEQNRAILYENALLEDRALVQEGVCYLELGTVRKYLNEIFYLDEAEGSLLYTDALETIQADIDQRKYTRGGAENTVSYVVWFRKGDKTYLALDFVKLFTNFSYQVYDYHMQLVTDWPQETVATVEKDTQVRLKGGIKSPIMTQVRAGDTLVVLERMETWCKVKTEDAIIGYVENKMIGEDTLRTPVAVQDYVAPEYPSLGLDKKVSLGWHSIGGVGGNTTIDSMVAGTKGLNVIAPTWFSLTDNEGNFRSFGDTAYVARAHQLGLQVWGVLDDFNYELETGNPISCLTMLSSTKARQKLEQGIVDISVELGLDGINLDFEQLNEECGVHFAQFLRELSVLCHEKGLILSVDNYVPYHFNEYRRLDIQGQVVDYVIIMGYDEHWHGSSDPGSVASIDYVTRGIEKTLEKVPAEKVINGLPLYTIVWKIDGAQVSDEFLTVANTQSFLSKFSIKPTWDETTCQNYLEWTQGSATYKVWLEDLESLKMKINVMIANKIGGLAVWRLGYGTPAVWELFYAFTGMK